MSRYIYDVLTNAGAPALPEGYFYRFGYAGGGRFRLEIRKHGRLFSRRVVSVTGWEEDLKGSSAIEYMKLIYEGWQAKIERGKHYLYGDHP